MPDTLRSPIVLASVLAVLFTIPLLVESLTAWVLPVLGILLLIGVMVMSPRQTRVVCLRTWERELNAELKDRGKGAILWCCLDQFDGFRQSHGDMAAEMLLTRYQKRLAEGATAALVMARDGDAFVLMAPGRKDITMMSRAVEALLEEPMEWRGREITMTATTGGVLYPDQNADARLFRELSRMEARSHHVVKTSSLIEFGAMVIGSP